MSTTIPALIAEADQLLAAIRDLDAEHQRVVELAETWAAHLDETDEEWPSASGLKGIVGANELAELVVAILRGEEVTLPGGWEVAVDDVEEAIALLGLAESRQKREMARREAA